MSPRKLDFAAIAAKATAQEAVSIAVSHEPASKRAVEEHQPEAQPVEASVAASAAVVEDVAQPTATPAPSSEIALAEEIASVEEIAVSDGSVIGEVATVEAIIQATDVLEVAQGPVDTHENGRDDESAANVHLAVPRSSSPRAKRPAAKMANGGDAKEGAKVGARSRKSAHIAPDGSGEIRVAVMLPDAMAAWIHRQSFSRGMGVRGKSAIVRECLDGWLAELDAMPAATRKETLRSLKSTNSTEGELKCYMFGISTQSLARLDEFASDWSLRLPVAVMMRVSVDRRMRGSVSTA
jgi:hypothetical protein